ncbi:MAG: HAD-IB family phosphatase [Ruminococcus sp.]
MNVYDFDNTIYDGDSTADFYIFCLKRHKKILTLLPKLAGAFAKFYIFKKGTKTQFKQAMFTFLKFADLPKDLEDFWALHRKKIKSRYIKAKKSDDVIISASPEFLLAPICKELGIPCPIASKVDCKSGVYTGINCHGEEKVRRFREIYPDSRIENFYSDSKSDAPMAKQAERAYLVKGDNISNWIYK